MSLGPFYIDEIKTPIKSYGFNKKILIFIEYMTTANNKLTSTTKLWFSTARTYSGIPAGNPIVNGVCTSFSCVKRKAVYENDV